LGDFIERSKKANSQLYDYSKVEYVNSAQKVVIGCHTHGDFTISPAKHIKGRGCQMCSREALSKRHTMCVGDFVSRATTVHSEAYDYSKAVYTSTHTPLVIRCKKCNIDFVQKPVNHLRGSGCPSCAKDKIAAHASDITLTNDEFIQRSTEKHGNLYDYRETEYTKSAEMVTIFCNRHSGYFQQTANSHMAGVGCASCASTGYSANKRGTLYVLTCGDITKIGITNLDPEARAVSISKSYGGVFSVMRKWVFDHGLVADRVETHVLRTLRKTHERPLARFQGSSEAFMNADRSWLIDEIDSEIARQISPT
jgi:hypothetical protein